MAIETPPKAPERGKPPVPPGSSPHRTDSDDGGLSRRGFLKRAGLAAGALAIGGGGAYLLKPEAGTPPQTTTPTVGETRPSIAPTTTPETTTPETTVPEVVATPLEQMQQRVTDFLNPNEFTREELNQWVYEKDANGLDNTFSYHGNAFAFPYVLGETQYNVNGTIIYGNGGQTYPVEPSFSFLNIIPEYKFMKLLMFHLGTVEVPLQTAKGASVSVTLMGGVLPASLGGDRFVSPFIVNINDPTNSALESATILGEKPYVGLTRSKNNIDDTNDDRLTGTVDRGEFLKQLQQNEGHPMVVSLSSIESSGYLPQDIIFGIDYFNQEHRNFYIDGAVSLLQGDEAGFNNAMKRYTDSGRLITDPNSDMPLFLKDGFKSIEEVFTAAPLGLMEFIKGSVPAPIIK